LYSASSKEDKLFRPPSTWDGQAPARYEVSKAPVTSLAALKGSQRGYEVCEVVHGVREVEREAEFPIPINVLCHQDKCRDSFHLSRADGVTWAWVTPGGGGVEGRREATLEGNSLHPSTGF